VPSSPVYRRCVSCRELLDRRGLWRVVRLVDGRIVLDAGQGRSAYLCPTRECLEEARRRKRLQRSLRSQVADSVMAELVRRLDGVGATPSEAR
jgi:predicted RNA-binding protein YlxR (DUF448 family)